MSPEEAKAFFLEEIRTWAKLIELARIKKQ